MPITLNEYFTALYSATTAPINQVGQAVPEVIDANGDGIQDILIFGAYYPFHGAAAISQPSLLMLGKADGTFAPAPSLLPPTLLTVHPREVVQADFNEDGFVDLFVADHGYDANPFPGAQNRLLLGTANGPFVDATANLPTDIDFTHSATAADINGDGHVDLFVGNENNSIATVPPYVLLGDGKGGFIKSSAGLPNGTGGFLDKDKGIFALTASLLTDLNGDGRADLVLGNEGQAYLKEHRSLVYWNVGSGFSANAVSYLPQGYFRDARVVHDITAFDMDKDGDKDLLLLGAQILAGAADGWSIELLRNDNGNFVDVTASHFQSSDSHEGLPNVKSNIGASEFIRLMDVNRDGTQDIVVTQFMANQPTANTPVVWTNDGFGHFEVALRAGELEQFVKDEYFVSVLTVPVETVNGVSFVFAHTEGQTLYQTSAIAQKPLPARVMTGSDKDDLIAQNDWSNIIEGGKGFDTVVYAKTRANYVFENTQGKFVISNSSGSEKDTLAEVERIKFIDGAIALDISGNAGQAYRLYQAAFDRKPDLGGLGTWIGLMDKGMSLAEVSSYFQRSEEFKTLYGTSVSNEKFVDLLYQNVLDRLPDANGYATWKGVLDAGTWTREQVLIGFSESTENQVKVIGSIQNGIEYQPTV